ncbi:unnamed protein product [Mytilus coruscus]|uniref:Uncharacterized protein n=1 Tax=Mytilus coruscus TaxID=42192 RepID=A0A6J8EFP3_MYTCO|nr:unnamed protein product [Mytilus coruscus]
MLPPTQSNTTFDATDMTAPSQSHTSNMNVNPSSESSNPSCSNIISSGYQQCSAPIEGIPNQVVNHLLQNNSSTDTFSTDLGQGLSRPLALGVNPKLKAGQINSLNLEDLLKSKSRVVKYVPAEKGDSLTFSNKAKIESLAHWQGAFYIYRAIYFEKYPNESPKLMKYATTIVNSNFCLMFSSNVLYCIN